MLNPHRADINSPIESLESRVLLSAVRGTAGDDTLYVCLDETRQFIVVYKSFPPSGNPDQMIRRGSAKKLSVNTFGGDDRIIIDLGNGNPIPGGGLALDAGSNGGGGDTLTVMGDGKAAAAFTPSATSASSGVVRIGSGTMSFVGVEPLTLNGLGSLTYVSPRADDQLVLDSPAPHQARLGGLSGGKAVKAVSFNEVGQLTLDLAAHDATGAGNDRLLVSAGGLNRHGLSKLDVRSGKGSNTLAFTGGTANLNPTLSAGGTLSISAGQTAVVNVTRSLDLSGLAVEGGAKVAISGGPAKVLRTRFISIGAKATLDVGGNELIVKAKPEQKKALADLLTRRILGARAGGAGLVSSLSKSDKRKHAGVFAIVNQDGAGQAVRGSFGQIAVDRDAVLVKYTSAADFNLDGRIAADDTSRLNRGVRSKLTGFQNGDANLDGRIDEADVVLFGKARAENGSTAPAPITPTPPPTTPTNPKPPTTPTNPKPPTDPTPPPVQQPPAGNWDSVDGWTDLKPAADSRVIYVSSSQGSDENSGLSKDSPVRTLGKAYTLLRNNEPDWMLLKRGDVWTGEKMGNGNWRIGGRSQSQPMVIGAYGSSSQRPIIRNTLPGALFGAYSASDISNLAVLGIHFQGSGNSSGAGLDRTSPGDNFLIEDCIFEKFSTGMAIQGFYSRLNNVTIRRSQVLDNTPVGTHAQGMFIHGVNGLLIEENLIDHNGWKNPDRSDAHQQNHNIYITNENSGVTVRRNIIANAASHGLQARAGGIIEDNVFVGNPIGMSFGLVNGGFLHAGGVSGRISGNVFLEATDINPESGRGWSIEISNTRPGAGTLIADNIFANDMSGGGFAAIQFNVPMGPSNPHEGVGLRDLTIERNVVYNMDGAIAFSDYLAPGASGYEGYSGLTVRNNDFQVPYNGYFVVHHGPAYSPSLESWSNNVYTTREGKGTYFRLPDGGTGLDQWRSTVEPSATVRAPAHPDPSRSVGRYAQALGLGSTRETFLAAARGQSRASWSSTLTAAAVRNYIRGGFVMRVTSSPR